MKIALVTGASSGMGREFVKQLDQNFVYNEIWVIARREDRLKALQKETRAKIRAIPMDLTKNESLDALQALLATEKPEISTLVCAGGFGRFGFFEDLSLSEQLEMIDLNDKALVAVTYLSLPYMTQGSEIYQLDSLSAFQPVPGIGIYAATKAFVLSFARSLNVELKPKGIRVMAVCPGWVKTEFFSRAVSDNTISYYNRFFTSEEVVRRALRDMKKGKDVSVCGFSIRLQVLLTKLLPHTWVMKIWCRQQRLHQK